MKENISEYKFSMFSIMMLCGDRERREGIKALSKSILHSALTVPIAVAAAVEDASSRTDPAPRISWAERKITASS